MFAKPLIAAVLATVSAAAIAADPGDFDPFVGFGSREAVEQISLSPAGSKVAFLAPGGGQSSVLYTIDLAKEEDPRRTLVADGNPERLRGCGWVSEMRLVCNAFAMMDLEGDLVAASRTIAVDSGGGNLKMLSRANNSASAYANVYGGGVADWLPGEDSAVLMIRNYVPEERQATRMVDTREGLAVERIDTATLATKIVETPKRDAIEYITDGNGNVRIMGIARSAGASGQDSGRIDYSYRPADSRGWKPLGTYDRPRRIGFDPYAVDPDKNVVYGFKRVDGRRALYSIALDGSMTETLVVQRPDVDVDGLIRIGRRNRVVGASYSTEKREAVYFDDELEAFAGSLSKALPGLPLIRFAGSSVDERKLLLWAGSDTDPGRYYTFDKGSKQLNEIMLARPELENVRLAPVKPIAFTAADGTQIPGYLTMPVGGAGKNLPAIVMPHGGPEARDEWGFDWLAQFYAHQGYAVLQPNFRGSAGYGDAWFQRNGFQSWKIAVGDVNDGGRWLVEQGIADPAKLAIVGWSYGGYAALQSNVLDPGLFKAVIAIAPVTDLPELTEESRNFSDFELIRAYIGTGPHLTEGSPARNAARIKAPVLMFHGDLDRNVGIRQSRLMADALKRSSAGGELIVYPKLDHYLEDSAARIDMLRKSDAFLRSALKL